MRPRLHITAEGQTEERYARSVLIPHLAAIGVDAWVRSVKTARKHGRDYRGGLLSYEKAKSDIRMWMNEVGRGTDAFFTTMFDLYALPGSFPGYAEAARQPNPYEKVAHLEQSFHADIDYPRFIPYIQLHEFEALILADPKKLDGEFLEQERAIRNLVKMVEGKNPEEINEGQDTAPSKRIIKEIPAYEGQKASVGPLVVEKIGLEVLRAKCRHFHEWLTRLEMLQA
jgi:hypothetical protein